LPHTHKRGLGRYRQPLDVAKRQRPAVSWPLLSACGDYGSDNMSAVNFVQRCPFVKLNFDFVPGFNHGAWNAWKGACKASGLWRHVLVVVIHFLCRHGPWNTAARLVEGKDGLKYYLRVARPRDCPWFMARLERLLRDWGWEHRSGEPGIAQLVWDRLSEMRPWEVWL